jgi:glutathione S-transferase
MLTLYYSPGACSMASHIALEETGAPYEAKLISTAKGEQRTPEYLAINPRGKVPALKVDNDVLTENVAILFYLAKRFSGANLLPYDLLEQARCLSTMAWLSNTVHPGFTRVFRPERFAADSAAHDSVKQTGREAFWASLQEVDGLLTGKSWLAGDQYTVCDPYALVFYAWGKRIELPVGELKSYTAWKDRMLARKAVRTILEREKSILLPTPAAAA